MIIRAINLYIFFLFIENKQKKTSQKNYILFIYINILCY